MPGGQCLFALAELETGAGLLGWVGLNPMPALRAFFLIETDGRLTLK